MKVTIEVTQDDIAKGQPAEASACPVALAIGRSFAHRDAEPFVGTCSVTWVFGEGATDMTMLPEAAVRWVENFDYEQPVEPFTFELNVPDHLLAGGAS